MTTKFIKFNDVFMDMEKDGLLKVFPELNTSSTYEIIATEYLADDDNGFGITKIKDVDTGAFFDINEITRLPEANRNLDLSYWCFVYTDYMGEFEFVEQ